jgi:phosphate:Na+ symporter
LSVLEGLLTPGVAVWLVAGANLGTSSTALLASAALDAKSRRLALLNTGFNVLGVLLFATLLQPVIGGILATAMAPSQQVALVHTLFNLTAALAALLLLPYLWPRLERWLNSGETP